MTQKWVSCHINVCTYNKKQSLLKTGLCDALHLDTLFQIKKFKYIVNILTESKPRISCLQINKLEIEKKRKTFFELKFFKIFVILNGC
jgi:hypothetical protein